MMYEFVLETVPQIDAVLVEKSNQYQDLHVPEQRRIVGDQIDTLLELRFALGQVAVSEQKLAS